MQSPPTQSSAPASPPQSIDTPTKPEQESKKLSTPLRPRAGQAPLACAVKALLRPILKVCYYSIRWIGRHKPVSLIAVILLIASMVATSYFITGTVPFASSDTITDNLQENPQLSPDIQNWLLALRSGDLDAMITIQKSISSSTRPPDSALYVMRFSEKYGDVTWTKARVMSLKQASDGLVDSLIEVDMTEKSSSEAAKLITLWHFTTLPSGHILLIDYVSSRSS